MLTIVNKKMDQKQNIVRKPSYYIKKRLFANKPAVFGLFVIIFACIVAVLGYLIMPDSTPGANDGAIQVQKQPPIFRTYFLKQRRNIEIPSQNIFKTMLFGKESEFVITPIKSFTVNGFNLDYIPDGRIQIPEKEPIITIVEHIKKGKSNYTGYDTLQNYKYENDKVYFISDSGKEMSYSQTELKEKLISAHIEQKTFLLGTDKAGRDLLSRLIFGTRISLGIGLISVIISLFVGVSIGAIGGFFGGYTDKFVMWLMTVVWSIPGIMLVIAISLALQSKGIWVAFVAVGLTTWVEIARVVRGQILSIKEKTYVEAAKALGLPTSRIILRHILPNLMGPIIVIATSNFASAILTEAGLSFLGLGVQPPTPSWGMMVNEGFHSMAMLSNSWHLIVMPSLAISVLVLSFNLFGNGLRDAYDPQSATKW